MTNANVIPLPQDADAAEHVAGAHLADLAGVERTTLLCELLGDQVGEIVDGWLHATFAYGREWFDYQDGAPASEHNPMLEDVPAIPLTIASVTDKLTELGIAAPTRTDCLGWAKVDRAAGGDGIDPQIELDRVAWTFDPNLNAPAGADDKRINGVPKPIYDTLTAAEQAKVRANRVIPPPTASTYAARWLVRHTFTKRYLVSRSRSTSRRAVVRILIRREQTWYAYERTEPSDPPRWVAHTDPEWMRARLRKILAAMWYVKQTTSTVDGEQRHSYKLKSWNPDSRTLRLVEDALADETAYSTGTAARELPDHYGEHHHCYPSGTQVLCRNGVLDVDSGQMRTNTALWFSLTRIEADYDHAADPYADSEWLAMLRTQWPDDPGAIKCLQQWFGYVVSGRTDLQKWMLILGPKGSGKSILADVLGKLIGVVTATSLDTLNAQFGLQSLYETGATLAVMSDIRFSARDSSTAVGNLLAITGEDKVNIERKHKTAVSTKLPTRFHGSANEMPRWSDNSDALASRALLLKTSRAFRGTDDEDHGLKDRIIATELAMVLRWAIEGLALLSESGGLFTVSARSEEMHDELADLSSPVRTFVGECCELGSGDDYVDLSALYLVWAKWAEKNKTGQGMSQNKFRSALQSLYLGNVRAGQKRMPDDNPGKWMVVWGIKRAHIGYTDRGMYGSEISRTLSTDPDMDMAPRNPYDVN